MAILTGIAPKSGPVSTKFPFALVAVLALAGTVKSAN